MKKLLINGQEVTITIHNVKAREVSFTLDGTNYRYRQTPDSASNCNMNLKREQDNHRFYWHKDRGIIEGRDVRIEEVPIHRRTAEEETGDNEIRSPMPGKILQINVKEGESVEQGQVLAVMEAMKMEHSITSPRQGIISGILWNSGDRVEGGVVLMEWEKKL